MTATWMRDVLLDAGVPVREIAGWRARTCGTLYENALVWHHDASAAGYSPGMPTYIAHQVDQRRPGANIWVGLDGTWWLIAAGMTFHAGDVLPGKPGNTRAIGIETDHTTGETWSGVDLLHSLRIGSAALLTHMRLTVSSLEFHKSICDPPGRKHDPDGLSLSTERRAVQGIMQPEEDDMAYKDWDPASRMMLAADVAGVILRALSEDGPEFTNKAAERIKKAAHASQHLHDVAGLKP